MSYPSRACHIESLTGWSHADTLARMRTLKRADVRAKRRETGYTTAACEALLLGVDVPEEERWSDCSTPGIIWVESDDYGRVGLRVEDGDATHHVLHLLPDFAGRPVDLKDVKRKAGLLFRCSIGAVRRTGDTMKSRRPRTSIRGKS